MLTVRSQQTRSMGRSTPNRQIITPCKESASWIEIRLIDEDDEPVSGAVYRLELPDGSLMEGVLDEKGLARYEGIIPGSCSVSFPEIDSGEWRPV